MAIYVQFVAVLSSGNTSIIMGWIYLIHSSSSWRKMITGSGLHTKSWNIIHVCHKKLMAAGWNLFTPAVVLLLIIVSSQWPGV